MIDYVDKLLLRLNKYADIELPLVFGHNDLFRNNILLEDDNIYVVDYEHAGENIIGYDLVNLAWTEHIKRNRSKMIINIIEGEYDGLFSQIFSCSEMDFEKLSKNDFIGIMVMFFIKLNYHVGEGYLIRVIEEYESCGRLIIS